MTACIARTLGMGVQKVNFVDASLGNLKPSLPMCVLYRYRYDENVMAFLVWRQCTCSFTTLMFRLTNGSYCTEISFASYCTEIRGKTFNATFCLREMTFRPKTKQKKCLESRLLLKHFVFKSTLFVKYFGMKRRLSVKHFVFEISLKVKLFCSRRL